MHANAHFWMLCCHSTRALESNTKVNPPSRAKCGRCTRPWKGGLAHALAPAGHAWGEAARGKAAKGRAAKGRAARGRATRRLGRGRGAATLQRKRSISKLKCFVFAAERQRTPRGRRERAEERSRERPPKGPRNGAAGGNRGGGGPGGPQGETVPASLRLALQELRFPTETHWMQNGSGPASALAAA